MNLLAIETSARVGSVAIRTKDGAASERELSAGRGQARDLAGAIEHLAREISLPLAALDGIAVGLGPGGYTGMRLAIATARALAFALSKPVVGIASTAAMAAGEDVPDGEVVVALDARKGFCYFARYTRSEEGVAELAAPRCVLAEQAALEVGPSAYVVGDARPHLSAALGRELAGSDVAFARARHVLALAGARFSSGDDDAPRTLDPLYLRPSEAELLWIRRRAGTGSGTGP